MPLRLRLTRDGLRITGPAPGATISRPPQAQVLLRTDNGELLVTDRGDILTLGPSDGQ
jgi:hypothetical protein